MQKLTKLVLYENSWITYNLSCNLATKYRTLRSFSFFDHFYSEFKLAGETLSDPWTHYNRLCFNRFLFLQGPTLHTLRLDKYFARDLKKLRELKHLNSLEINKIIGDVKNCTVPSNIPVKSFIARQIDDKFLIKILKSWKLKSIYICYVKPYQLSYILEKARNIENIAYFHLSSTDEAIGEPTNSSKVFETSLENFLKHYF
jgi:hypothetical protein